MNDSDFERIVDGMVWKRLATDPAYNNAESAEAQAAREEEITDQCVRELAARHVQNLHAQRQAILGRGDGRELASSDDAHAIAAIDAELAELNAR